MPYTYITSYELAYSSPKRANVRPMGRDVLVVMDPLERIDPAADSTHVMITEALRRGHRPFFTTADGLGFDGRAAFATVTPLRCPDPAQIPETAGPAERRGLADFDAVLMRKDPPVDQNYCTAAWILDRARAQTLLINDPRGLLVVNEKLSILGFPEFTPRTMILRRKEDLHRALDELGGKMIVKPVFGFGGREILFARKDDPNLNSLLEMATLEAGRWTVAQEFVEKASEGDKRILMVDGEPIGAVLRVPAKGELRGNFHVGGSAVLTQLDEADRAICSAVGPMLVEHGQFFAGIDVIGGRLTEINVTSPTGMQEVNRLQGLEGDATMQARFWDALERRIATA